MLLGAGCGLAGLLVLGEKVISYTPLGTIWVSNGLLFGIVDGLLLGYYLVPFTLIIFIPTVVLYSLSFQMVNDGQQAHIDDEHTRTRAGTM